MAPMIEPILTIAIPTFDRNAQLQRTIESLLPQLTSRCRLLILDNHSPRPVEDTLRPTLDRFPQIEKKLIRHPYNIGGHANFLRCFEVCQTEYLWMLGDDDPPKPHAVQVILEHLAAHPAVAFFNFSASALPTKRSISVTTRGLDELINHIDHFGLLIWISACVYRCAAIREELRYSCGYLQGVCPQFLPVLRVAKSGAECHLSAIQIIDYSPPPPAESYSQIFVALAAVMFLDMSWTDSERRRLSEKVLFGFGFAPRGIARALHDLAIANHEPENSLYWFDQIMSRCFYFKTGLLPNIERILLRQLLRFPYAANRLLQVWRFLLHRPAPVAHQTNVFTRA